MAKTILITGGSSGIGLASARKFLTLAGEINAGEERTRMILCARDLNGLNNAATDLRAAYSTPSEISKASPQIETYSLDVSVQSAVETLFETVGPVDILVTAAGICEQARLDEAQSDAVWQRTFDVNVHGTYYCVKAAAQTMPAGGAIVTVASGLGKNARAAYQAYTASKHAVLGLTKCVALELAPRKIRVNAVCPGWVDTPMSRADAALAARRAGLAEAAFRARAIEQIPLGRMVMPEEVAELIAFLASPAAASITGQSYNISGGEFFN